MENIVIVEKLCEKLQNSDRPIDLGVAIALRVVLDENITIDELRAEAVSNYGRTLKRNSELAVLYHKSETENTQLKEANNILTVEIEQANKIIDFYKSVTAGKYKTLNISSTLDFISARRPEREARKPTQTAIEFPVTSSPKAVAVNEREKSAYYRKANKRALKIFSECKKDEDWFILNTNHIVPWVNKFFLKPGEKLRYSHIEYACLPKCHGGLGSFTGMLLEQWVIKALKSQTQC